MVGLQARLDQCVVVVMVVILAGLVVKEEPAATVVEVADGVFLPLVERSLRDSVLVVSRVQSEV